MTAAWLLDGLIAGSLQAIVLVAFVWTVCRLLPRLPASLMTALWWLVALKLLLVLLPLPAIPLPLLSEPVVPVAAPGVVPFLRTVPLTAEPVSTDWWPIAAMLVWCAGLAMAAGRLVMAYWSARGVVSRATVAEVPDVDALAAAVGLTHVPRIRCSTEVAAPQVVGSWRPVIVLPASMPLDGEECRLALGHELMHVRRHDVALGWIPAVAERLFFFHPLVRLAAREYLTAREAACDAALVTALGVDPADYGRLLVRFGITPAPAAFAAGSAASSSASLLRRLNMLQQPPARSSARVATVVCAALVVAMVPMKLVARSAPELPDVAPVVLTQLPAPDSVVPQPAPDAAPRGRSVRRPGTSSEAFTAAQDDLLAKLAPGVKAAPNPYSIETYLSPADLKMYRDGVRRGFTDAEWRHLQEVAAKIQWQTPWPSDTGGSVSTRRVVVTGVVMPQSERDQQAAAAAAQAQAQAQVEAAKAAEARQAAEVKAAEQQARETALQAAKELEARRRAVEQTNAQKAAAARRFVVERRADAAVLDEYAERLKAQTQMLQKQMDALRDQIRELERALELQKRELAKKK